MEKNGAKTNETEWKRNRVEKDELTVNTTGTALLDSNIRRVSHDNDLGENSTASRDAPLEPGTACGPTDFEAMFKDEGLKSGRLKGKKSMTSIKRKCSGLDSLTAFSEQTAAEDGVDFSLPRTAFEDSVSASAKVLTEKNRLKDFEAEQLIQRIMGTRSLLERNQFMDTRDSSRSRLNSQDSCDTSRPGIHKLPPPRKAWQAVTSPSSGKRFYLDLKDSSSLTVPQSFYGAGTGDLLSSSFPELVRQVEHARQEKLLQEADAATRVPTPVVDVEVMDTEGETPASHLWVEKYRPRVYTDLISDEGTNRTLLTWLKLWDEVVFGRVQVRRKREAPTEDDEDEQANEKPVSSKTPGHGGKFSTPVHKKKFDKWSQDADEVPTELDKYKRPQHKIALLAGPPGLGKTTLAHIIARHAGYRPAELNASDDRTIEKFRRVVDDATQMRTTLDADPRPSCVIADEIDGAPVACINYLLSLTKEKEQGKKRSGVLRRPIICICNDLYAPALRELRKQALLISFGQIDQQRLVQRLAEICAAESCDVDDGILNLLCEKTANDIRSCLNTLQLVHKQKLKRHEIEKLSIGQKDMQKGLFTLWDEIFTKPIPRGPAVKRVRTATGYSIKEDDTSSLHNRFNSILKGVYFSGDEDKLRSGVFENYLSMPFKDPKLESVKLSSDWLQLEDLLTSQMRQKQVYELLPYLPFVPVLFHLLFAVPVRPRISWPVVGAHVRTKTEHNKSIVVHILSGTAPIERSFVTERDLLLHLLPYLLYIISPSLRPVSTQLYNKQEKMELHRVVGVMIAYNLTYIQRRTPEGQLLYALEPEIDDVVQFIPRNDRPVLSLATRQLIAREIELEKISRNDKVGNSNQPLLAS